MEPECDCVYARYYYAMAKLAIYEQSIPFKELPKYLNQRPTTTQINQSIRDK